MMGSYLTLGGPASFVGLMLLQILYKDIEFTVIAEALRYTAHEHLETHNYSQTTPGSSPFATSSVVIDPFAPPQVSLLHKGMARWGTSPQLVYLRYTSTIVLTG